MRSVPGCHGNLDEGTCAFYARMLALLNQSDVPVLMGGAYALERYTGIGRHTKDLDIFTRPEDCRRLLDLCSAAGYRTELTFAHWLGKVYGDGNFIDVIFSSGNGIARVDDGWFEHAVDGQVLGVPVRLCPPEEMIWSKSFVMERERYDGADIAHLLRAVGSGLNWRRLLRRFADNWPVLLSHLVLFGYIYPAEQRQVPAWVLEDLLGRLRDDMHCPSPRARVCRGILLSRAQYLIDIEQWGYPDARLAPAGNLTAEEIKIWTAPAKEPLE